MNQKTVATEAAIFIALALLIAGVLEALARISNLLNQPINPVLLAAGAISAAILGVRRRVV
jgi:2-keto-4-pentenoate hydratase